MTDLTGDYDYERLIAEEKEHFAQIDVREDLTEGGIHGHDSWAHYWSRIGAQIVAAGRASIVAQVLERAEASDRPLQILSLGSGYCGHELSLAQKLANKLARADGALARGYSITCTDINEALFERARVAAEQRGLNLRFEGVDLNFIDIEPDHYDLIFAHASLHHVINLERLYERIALGLVADGLFHLVETVGQNRRLLWRENERFVNRALRLLPMSIRRAARIKVHPEDGMEGVRAEEIVPLLAGPFTAVFELQHGAFMRHVCTHRRLGVALDPGDQERRRWLDLLVDMDASCVRSGMLRPIEVWGLYQRRQ